MKLLNIILKINIFPKKPLFNKARQEFLKNYKTLEIKEVLNL